MADSKAPDTKLHKAFYVALVIEGVIMTAGVLAYVMTGRMIYLIAAVAIGATVMGGTILRLSVTGQLVKAPDASKARNIVE